MLPILLTLVMATSSMTPALPYVAFIDDAAVQDLPVATSTIHDDIIPFYAHLYGVDVDEMEGIVQCESGYGRYELGDYVNGTATSFGLAQLHNPLSKVSKKYPHGITVQQAMNPFFAANYLAESLHTHSDHWSCQKILGFL